MEFDNNGLITTGEYSAVESPNRARSSKKTEPHEQVKFEKNDFVSHKNYFHCGHQVCL